MYVLLLKSANEQSADVLDDPYVQVLKNAGFIVSLVETLDFTYHTGELECCQSWRDNHSAILFTSPRAVTAIAKAGLKGLSSDLCFVVGPSTELQAKKIGFLPKGAHTGDASSLSKYIQSDFLSVLKKPIFFPAGNLHQEELPRCLENHGIKVNTVIAYSTHEKENLKERFRLNLCEGNPIPDCIVYFSPSGVSFTEDILKTELKPHRPNVKLVAMGKSTASQLQQLGMTVAAVPTSPKPESLLSVIQQLAFRSSA